MVQGPDLAVAAENVPIQLQPLWLVIWAIIAILLGLLIGGGIAQFYGWYSAQPKFGRERFPPNASGNDECRRSLTSPPGVTETASHHLSLILNLYLILSCLLREPVGHRVQQRDLLPIGG